MKKFIIKNKIIVFLVALTVALLCAACVLAGVNNQGKGNSYVTGGTYAAYAEETSTESDAKLKELKVSVSTNGKYLLLVTAFDDSILKEDGFYYIGYKYTFNGQEVDTTQIEGAKTATYYGSVKLKTESGVTEYTAKDIYSNDAYADYGLIVYEIEFETSYQAERALLENLYAFITEVESNGEGGFKVVDSITGNKYLEKEENNEQVPTLKEEVVTKAYDVYALENKESIEIDFAENVNNEANLELTYSAQYNNEDIVLDGSKYTFNLGEYTGVATTEAFTVTVSYVANEESASITYVYNLEIKDSTEYNLYNGGFENGLDGWTKVGNIGDVDTQTHYWVGDKYSAEGYLFGMDGAKMFSAYTEGATEASVGTLTSSTFKVGGSGFITFKIGGVKDGNYVYLDVVDASTKQILARYYNGNFSDVEGESVRGCTLVEYKANLSAFNGKEVFIKLSDNADSNYGLFFVDSVVTYYEEEPQNVADATPVDYNVSGTIYDLFNGGFEVGGLQGWLNVGDAGQVTAADAFFSGVAYGKNGTYLYSGVEDHGAGNGREGNQGVLTSSAFELAGTGYITYMLGGGNTYCYVQVIDATNNQVLARYRQQNRQDAVLIQYVADLSAHVGKLVRIQVIDNASSDWGCISFDNVVTYYTDVANLPEGLTANDVKYDIVNGSFENGLDGWKMYITEAGAHNTLGWVESSEHDADWYTKNDDNKDGNFLFTFTKPDGTNCENTKGTLQTENFVLKQNAYVSFRFGGAGGGQNHDVKIELRKANGEVIATFYNDAEGKVNTRMNAYYYQYQGAETDCYFAVVDNSTGDYGCFVVDDFRVNLTAAPEGFIQAIQA